MAIIAAIIATGPHQDDAAQSAGGSDSLACTQTKGRGRLRPAGAFAPQVMETIGWEVVPLGTELDHSFPKCYPNPEAPDPPYALRVGP